MKENMKEPPPLTILPWGTSNDLARQINRGRCTPWYLIALKKNAIWLDIGRVNDCYFVNVVAAEMFADVAYLNGKTVKSILGKPAYYLHGLNTILAYRPFQLKVNFDSNSFEEELLLFLVLNGSRAGGLFCPAPEATLCDGKLHLVALKKGLRIPQLGGVLRRALRGESPHHPEIIYVTAEKVYLHFPPKLLSVVDGERGPHPPLKLNILPSRLPFISITGQPH